MSTFDIANVFGNDSVGRQSGCTAADKWLKHVNVGVITSSCDRRTLDMATLVGNLVGDVCAVVSEFDGLAKMDHYSHQKLLRHQLTPRRLQADQDTNWNLQWSLRNDSAFSVRAEGAWLKAVGGTGSAAEQPGNTVAVVDSNHLISHPDLVNKWYVNAGEVAADGNDNDANGFIDDVNGWNFGANSNDHLEGGVSPVSSHGTRVASCVAAETGNSLGIASVCRNCRVLPLSTYPLTISSIIEATNYALSRGVKVINYSLSTTSAVSTWFQVMKDVEASVLFVVSAANDGCDLDLSSCPNIFPNRASLVLKNVITVGAHNSVGSIASFSNVGAQSVQVFAPGESVLTAGMDGASAPTFTLSSGTSFSSPIVAGIAGLIRQKYSALSPCQVREAIVASCTLHGPMTGKAVCNGYVNAEKAIDEAASENNSPRFSACLAAAGTTTTTTIATTTTTITTSTTTPTTTLTTTSTTTTPTITTSTTTPTTTLTTSSTTTTPTTTASTTTTATTITTPTTTTTTTIPTTTSTTTTATASTNTSTTTSTGNTTTSTTTSTTAIATSTTAATTTSTTSTTSSTAATTTSGTTTHTEATTSTTTTKTTTRTATVTAMATPTVTPVVPPPPSNTPILSALLNTKRLVFSLATGGDVPVDPFWQSLFASLI
eukprot:GHVS01066618.1.p1 GENE.GHVS01066618.1~~GHVS01066618.1.p1  ORF type:complete len:659 (-),score=131.67 GHVS01066618.1:529-2505(-)